MRSLYAPPLHIHRIISRWLRLLFSREFADINDALVLWDCIFAFDAEKLGLVDWIAVALLLRLRSKLVDTSQSCCLVALMQTGAIANARPIVEAALSLQSKSPHLNSMTPTVIQNDVAPDSEISAPIRGIFNDIQKSVLKPLFGSGGTTPQTPEPPRDKSAIKSELSDIKLKLKDAIGILEKVVISGHKSSDVAIREQAHGQELINDPQHNEVLISVKEATEKLADSLHGLDRIEGISSSAEGLASSRERPPVVVSAASPPEVSNVTVETYPLAEPISFDVKKKRSKALQDLLK